MNIKPDKPDYVEKKGKTPNGGDRAVGVFLDNAAKPVKKKDAKYFVVKEFKNGQGICTITYKIKTDGKLLKMAKTFTDKKK